MLRSGWRPVNRADILSFRNFYSAPGVREEARRMAVEHGRDGTEEDVRAFLRLMHAQDRAAVADVTYDPKALEGAVAVAADDVARYFDDLPLGTNISDLVGVVPTVPPFETMLIDFQQVSNEADFLAWGALVEGWRSPPANPEAEWTVGVSLFGEWRRGEFIGPILLVSCYLDRSGHLIRQPDEDGVSSAFRGNLPSIPGLVPEVAAEAAGLLLNTIFPVILALGFMNCRNVTLSDAPPVPRRSAKHAHRQRTPLRYQLLDIEPMRRVLNTEGQAHSKGLRHALHICRGHFKTFTDEAPLFGKITGTYWWTPQVRGAAERGVVVKDYRVRLEQGTLGTSYHDADEAVEVARPIQKPGESEPPPDVFGRGLRAHNRTQNLLAVAVRQAGFDPRSPDRGDVEWDLMWQAGDETWVAEVKSISPENEERQLRLAVGQVKRYAQTLAEAGLVVRPMIAVECHPYDESWIDLCNSEAIVLAWPEVFAAALGVS